MNNQLVFAVTGGGNGIGREVVLNLLNRGFKVAAIDLSLEALAKTKELSGNKSDNLKTYELNITDLEKTELVHKTILEEFKRIDGIINVAGIIQPFVKVVNLEVNQIKRVMDVNFYGTVNITKTFLPGLISNKQKTYLVNVSSMGGFLPVPGQSVYGASKAAVKLYTEGLYAELLDTKVSVSIVFPGAIGTEITKNSGIDMGDKTTSEQVSESKHKVLSPKKAAEIIIKGMFKEKLYIYVGKDSKMMNFMYKRMPKRSIKMISNNMKDLLK